jgi:hypothetical protein
MRTVDHFRLLGLSLDVLRERGFEQNVAAHMALETYPRRDVIQYFKKKFSAEDDHVAALLFFPAALLLLTHRHASFQLWVTTPRFVRFFQSYEPAVDPRHRQTPLFRVDGDGLTLHGERQVIDVTGNLHTSLEHLKIVIFLVDERLREGELKTLIKRVVDCDADFLLILPDEVAKEITPTLRPQLSMPMTWDPPLTLQYRSRWLPRAEEAR